MGGIFSKKQKPSSSSSGTDSEFVADYKPVTPQPDGWSEERGEEERGEEERGEEGRGEEGSDEEDAEGFTGSESPLPENEATIDADGTFVERAGLQRSQSLKERRESLDQATFTVRHARHVAADRVV